MRLTLLTFPLISLFPLAASTFTEVSADDARIEYYQPPSSDRPTRALCTASPRYCHNMWWHEPNAASAYTTMGPVSSLRFSFTGAEGITVYGNRDSGVQPTALLNGVNYTPGPGSRTLFTADNLNPDESYTLILTFESDLTQRLANDAPSDEIIQADGFLTVSEIVLDMPDATVAPKITAPRMPIPNLETSSTPTNGTLSASNTKTDTASSLSSQTALDTVPNVAPASNSLEPEPSPTIADATAGTPPPAHPKSHAQHMRDIVLPVVLCVVTLLALLAGCAFWRWRRSRESAWETRIICAYDSEPAPPDWRLPMQMPKEEEENEGRFATTFHQSCGYSPSFINTPRPLHSAPMAQLISSPKLAVLAALLACAAAAPLFENTPESGYYGMRRDLGTGQTPSSVSVGASGLVALCDALLPGTSCNTANAGAAVFATRTDSDGAMQTGDAGSGSDVNPLALLTGVPPTGTPLTTLSAPLGEASAPEALVGWDLDESSTLEVGSNDDSKSNSDSYNGDADASEYSPSLQFDLLSGLIEVLESVNAAASESSSSICTDLIARLYELVEAAKAADSATTLRSTLSLTQSVTRSAKPATSPIATVTPLVTSVTKAVTPATDAARGILNSGSDDSKSSDNNASIQSNESAQASQSDSVDA
ncbi:hypothetical protein AURDEDRAFT_185788 [Auricularia subglabra TFB-10046 SS5]|nr:hypothetical protein AURDEDRAFT_185788 [Auricularia subglabra TFB-10046 SS5]